MSKQHTCDWAAKVHSESWYCDLCIGKSSAFGDRSEFETHLTVHHGSQLSQSQLRGRLRRNKRSLKRDVTVCPLCDCTPEGIMTESGDERYRSLWRHIGSHIKFTASLSLPIDQTYGIKTSLPELSINDQICHVPSSDFGKEQTTEFPGQAMASKAQTDPHLALVDTILDSLYSSNFDASIREYLPDRRLTQLITFNAIVGEFSKYTMDGVGVESRTTSAFFLKLAKWVSTNASRTFAIATICGLSPSQLSFSMATFREYGFSDADLPIPDPRKIDPPPATWPRKIWTSLRLRDFHGKQWLCLAPVFSHNLYNYDLSHENIFPFKRTSAPPKVGAFSAVHKIVVHPEHQRYENIQHVSGLLALQYLM
jgi:hypothetical protein